MSVSKLIVALRRFSTLDQKMQLSTVLTLLEIHEAERRGENPSVGDIAKRIGLRVGTASRNIYYWADGHQAMSGAYEYITIAIHPTDRRLRVLKLTPKGRAFMDDLKGDIND